MKRFKRNILFSIFMPIILFLRGLSVFLTGPIGVTVTVFLSLLALGLYGGKIISNVVKPDKNSIKSILYALLLGVLYYLRWNAASITIGAYSSIGLGTLLIGSIAANTKNIIKENKKNKIQEKTENIVVEKQIVNNNSKEANEKIEKLQELKRDIQNYQNLQEEIQNNKTKTR